MLVLVTESCPTLCDPVDCSPPGFLQEIFQTQSWTHISYVPCIAGEFFTKYLVQYNKVNFAK